MRTWPTRGAAGRRLALEALAAGLAYGAGLCWASVCLVASFRPGNLSAPYWRGGPGLRTDSTGIMAFSVLAVCFAASEYLRLSRRRGGAAGPAREVAGGEVAGGEVAGGTARLLALAISETVALLATGLVVYLSVNAVTHPATLQVHATHLAPWPTEGTLRVVALFLCACSVAVLRCLWAVAPASRGVKEACSAPDLSAHAG
jgi:hypothetical protein